MSALSIVRKPKMLWVGDAGAATGFARATHHYLESLAKDYDLTVLGLSYFGDPHEWPYPIYPAFPGGDIFGVERIVWMCDLVKKSRQDGTHRRQVPEAEWSGPDVIVIQQDPWNFPDYHARLKKQNKGEFKNVPVVGIVAVDALNCRGDALNDLTLAVFWTQFGLDEARKGGFTKAGVVIPLGVDLDIYRPIDKVVARHRRGITQADDAFIVGNVNRNQPRKRLDLTIRVFAQWVRSGRLKDAYLYLHIAPTGETGVDAVQLAHYYDIANRVACIAPQSYYGATEDELNDTYNCFDVQISTTKGEGFGLTTIEGMAAGVPQLVGDWSALGEWATAAVRVPCSGTDMNIVSPGLNTIGGVPDEAAMVAELDRLWKDRAWRDDRSVAGLALARKQIYRWDNIAEALRLAVNCMVRPLGERSVPEEKEEATA